jgi:hypothetical protein
MNRYDIDRQGAAYAAATRALVATAFVAGFAALVWVHVDLEAGNVPALATTSDAPALRGPRLPPRAGRGSVGARREPRVRRPASYDVPPVPTF